MITLCGLGNSFGLVLGCIMVKQFLKTSMSANAFNNHEYSNSLQQSWVFQSPSTIAISYLVITCYELGYSMQNGILGEFIWSLYHLQDIIKSCLGWWCPTACQFLQHLFPKFMGNALILKFDSLFLASCFIYIKMTADMRAYMAAGVGPCEKSTMHALCFNKTFIISGNSE